MYPLSVTIYDIAKEAGVSGSTVSRVLNGKPGVNAQTRKKVQALLEAHHFFANEAARGLVMQTPRMMGILVADIRNSHYAEGAYLIAQEFANHGYGALICNTGDDDPSKVDSLRVLASRRVDGVALIGSTFQCDAVRDALQLYFATTPVVIANGYVDLPQAYGVVADEAEGIASCVRLLLGQGRRHLAFVNGTDTPSNRIKQQGFLQEVEKNLTVTSYVIQASSSEYQAGYDATASLLVQHPQVDGIIYAVDLLAAGGLRAVQDAGRAVPQSVAVIGVDNSPYTYVTTPRLTSLDTKLGELSLGCARALVDAVEGKPGKKKQVIVSSIVLRETT